MGEHHGEKAGIRKNDPKEGKTIRKKERRSEKGEDDPKEWQPGNEEYMYQFFVEDEQIANDLVTVSYTHLTLPTKLEV